MLDEYVINVNGKPAELSSLLMLENYNSGQKGQFSLFLNEGGLGQDNRSPNVVEVFDSDRDRPKYSIGFYFTNPNTRIVRTNHGGYGLTDDEVDSLKVLHINFSR